MHLVRDALVGHPPFTGESIEEIARQHRDIEAPRIDGIVFECPVWRGVIELYGNKLEFKALVDRAESKLHPVVEGNAES